MEAWITASHHRTRPIKRREHRYDHYCLEKIQLHLTRTIRFGGCGCLTALQVQIPQEPRGVVHARGQLEPLEAMALKSTAP